jgi:cytochrome P450
MLEAPLSPDADAAPAEIAAKISYAANYGKPDEVHAAFAWLRANQPVSKIYTEDFRPYWAITKHADILEIERQDALFLNGARPLILSPAVTQEALARLSAKAPSGAGKSIVAMDGDDHRKYRALTHAWFMPGNVRKLEERMGIIARAHVERMAARGGRCDFHADVALHYPIQVVMEILGLPPEDEPRMLKLTQQLFGARDPDLSRSAGDMQDPVAAAAVIQSVINDFNAYFTQLTIDRRASPRDDVASVIANALVDGELISQADANAYYQVLATAGHDTTSASTAGAIWAMAERPDELAKVQADPSLVAGLIEEAIRWVTPVKHFMRTATQDYELRGRTIRAGDWLLLSYMSGNRDEEVFEDPFEFRVDRKPNKHISFGYGAHVCLGMHLARLEMRVLFEALLPKIKSLALDGDPKWAQTNFVSGPKRLPIRFELA